MRHALSGLLIGLTFTATLQAAPAPLDTVEATIETLPREELFDGVIEAINRSTVSAQTSGRVEEINFDIDDYVEKGSVLLRLRNREQQATVESAQAQFNEASAEFRRIAEVYEKKLVAKSAYDKAEAAKRSAQAALAQAKEQMANTVVTAPYSGIVITRHIELGETANPGTPLMTGISLEHLRAVANVPQAYVDEVRDLKQAVVVLTNPQSQRLPATHITVAPHVDPTSHTFKVRADLPVGQHGIFPGMFAKVAFATGEEQLLTVPQQAVVYRGEVTAVYVVAADGTISMRHIRLGRQLPEGRVVILAGLSAGERVALDPIRATVVLKQQRAGNE